MKVNTQNLNNNELLVSVSGEFDALGCQTTKTDWDALSELDQISHLILELSQVSFLDSSGVGAIVFLFKRLKSKSIAMSLAGATGQPQELLSLLRIHQAIPETELNPAHC
ncbi:STAS domain-containing protein [Catenovulum sp. SM1970]|uniref:STAS domain-containing protein n=1 Tax=Marinifaba aquimaris TaxID=2741323 RepID=UPI0015731A2E|nr:STAS domain-containing protein [Marinifaba aquimaris]NTS76163.1 STAS domain-containing protein [Marinifaba aquimaris]